jgi:hypothetical protein
MVIKVTSFTVLRILSSRFYSFEDFEQNLLFAVSNLWRHNTEHNDVQHNDTQHKELIRDSQHDCQGINDTHH